MKHIMIWHTDCTEETKHELETIEEGELRAVLECKRCKKRYIVESLDGYGVVYVKGECEGARKGMQK